MAKPMDAADFAAHGTVPDPDTVAKPVEEDGWPALEVDPYRSSAAGMFRVVKKKEKDGEWTEYNEPLTNFAARIVTSVIEDDGAETRRFVEVETYHNGKLSRFQLPSHDFASMNWPIEQLGPNAIVYAGLGKRDHTRAAIQLLSRVTQERRVYAHTGWRKIDGADYYLHSGGAIGAIASMTTEMALPVALRNFALPQPPTGKQLTEAVAASLRMVGVGPSHVTVPVYALVSRAILGGADFSGWIAGPTGAFKSALAALAQQHFGAGMDGRNLPAAWQSTANANQELAFAAKDALLVVDDFVAVGSGTDAQRLHRDADTLIRGQGNRAGRQRMRADATLRPPRPPRGLILGTGEDVPRGQSLRGRTNIVEVGGKDIDRDKLTVAQADAAAGLYSAATAGFVRWLAGRHLAVLERFRTRMAELRAEAAEGADHRRTPEITAQLGAALEIFLAFARSAGAVTDERKIWSEWWTALRKVSRSQAEQQAESDPAKRFVELLRSAVSAGGAHLADSGKDGGAPENPSSWGWRREGLDMRPKGDCVGWVDIAANDLFLDFDTAHRVVRDHAATGEAPTTTAGQLRKRLSDAGLLKTVDVGTRGTLFVRRVLAGQRRTVLHLAANTLVEASDGQVSANWSGRSETAAAPNGPQNGDSAGEKAEWSGRAGWSGEKGETHKETPR